MNSRSDMDRVLQVWMADGRGSMAEWEPTRAPLDRPSVLGHRGFSTSAVAVC